jgi:hypothetical protein
MAKKKNYKRRVIPDGAVSKQTIDLVKQTNYSPLFFWKNSWLEISILALFSCILYFQSISYGYLLDDKIVITENAFTKKGFNGISEILTTESFQGYFGEQKDLVAGARYRPLSIVSFAVEYGIAKSLKPGISHFINILLYALCSIFLYRTLLLLFPFDSTKSRWLQFAFLASLLWLTHPVHSEAVANIKGRDEIMSLLFALLALIYSVKFSIRDKGVYLILAGIAFFLGLLSKEGAITFLGIIPLSLYFFTKTKSKQYLYIISSLFAATIAYLIIRYNVIGYFLSSGKEITDLMNNPFYGMSGAEKSATIMYTLVEYLRLSFFPLTLTHDYYPFHIPTVNWGNWKVLLSLLLHLSLAFFALKGLKKKTIPAFAILFYAFALSIASNVFFPVGTFMNERFIFTATIGACIGIGWVLLIFLPDKFGPRYKYLYTGLFILLVTFFSVRTLIRVPVWESAMSLNKAAVKVSVNSARANCFMGTALFNMYRETTDQNEKSSLLDEAEFYINKSADLFPAYNNANVMIAGIAAEKYKVDRDLDRLLNEFKRVIQYRPETEFIHQYLDYVNERNTGQKMIDFYLDASRVIDVSVPNRPAWRVKYLQYAYSIDPNNKLVNLELGKIFEQAGNAKQADFHYSKAGGRN